LGRPVALPEYYYKRKEKGRQKRGREKKISFHYVLFYVEGGVFLETEEKQLNPLWNSLYREKYAIRIYGNADPASRAVFPNSLFPWNPFALKTFFTEPLIKFL
jgi:hypothetical protein